MSWREGEKIVQAGEMELAKVPRKSSPGGLGKERPAVCMSHSWCSHREKEAGGLFPAHPCL